MKKTTSKDKSTVSFSARNISNARAPDAVLDMHSCTKAAPENCSPITERSNSSSSAATLYLSNKNDKKTTGATTEKSEDSLAAGLNSKGKVVQAEVTETVQHSESASGPAISLSNLKLDSVKHIQTSTDEEIGTN